MLNVPAHMLMRGDEVSGHGEILNIEKSGDMRIVRFHNLEYVGFYSWEIVTLVTDEAVQNYGF